MSRPRRSIVERFWPKVNKRGPNECWLYVARKKAGQYGLIDNVGNELNGECLSHRVSWCLAFGPIPEGLNVLHSCDVPKCVNPRHLFLGTAKDNSDDKVSKKRHSFGVKHGRAKMTEQQVRSIVVLRKLGWSQHKIADYFKVSQSAISHVINGRNWRHLE